MSMDYEINNEHQSSVNDSISKLTDLSLDIMHEIFDYLTLGDIYYSFYNLLNNFIDNCFSCLNLISMSYRQFIYYYKYISFNNIEHCRKIDSLIISNEKPFNQIEKFFPIIDRYVNIKILYVYSPNKNQLEILPLILPNLSQLYIIIKTEKFTNINWLSSLKKLEKCSINPKTYGIEIDNSLHSLSTLLSSLSITVSSTYDFYTLLSRLSIDTIHYLDISLFDSEFCYTKTHRSPISLATKLTDFSFNISLIPMKNASCLYDIIRFISSTLHHIQTLTIICRFADGIFIDEEKLRNYLSFTYSVKKYKLFIEMNYLPKSSFDEKAYTYPFWIEKGIHVNIYRNKDDQIKRVRIYTLPLDLKIVNLPNQSEDMIKSPSVSSNIYQFKSNGLCDSVYHFDDDLTATPNRIYSSSNISLFFYLPRLSSFQVTENEMFSFLRIFSQDKSFPFIRKLQLDYWPQSLMKNTQQIFNIFPCLQSLSIGKVDELDIFGDILDKFLVLLPNKQVIIHLHVGGLYFDDIFPAYLANEQLKTNLEDIFIPVHKRKISYNISFDRNNRFIDIWL